MQLLLLCTFPSPICSGSFMACHTIPLAPPSAAHTPSLKMGQHLSRRLLKG
ncbi:unnamed protein product [Staurois parvus]|uniref:Uncharacterized protein n=1 Tax=Staurois parvus TaxID=386267 RepID=A0ABN9DFR8_9NEOB|nr:unnamed protein product [Staurois parvus]